MKTTVYSLIIGCLFLCQATFCQPFNKQNTYLDAKKLSEIYEQLENCQIEPDLRRIREDFNTICKKYMDTTSILNNPFLNKHYLEIISKEPQDQELVDRITHLYSADKTVRQKAIDEISEYLKAEDLSPVQASGLNWQASLINGISNFMAGRFKQEILQVGISQVFDNIKKDSAIIKVLFPQTFTFINRLSNKEEVYYTADLLFLRQLMITDIEKIPYNLIANASTLLPGIENNPIINDMLLLGSGIVNYSQNGYPLDKLITSLSEQPYSEGSSVDMILNILDLVSQALLDEDGSDNIWVNPIKNMPILSSGGLNSETMFFYGLLLEQFKSIPMVQSYFIEQQETCENIEDLARQLQGFILVVNNLNSAYNYLKTKEFKIVSVDELFFHINEIQKIIFNYYSSIKSIPDIKIDLDIKDEAIEICNKYFTIAEAIIRKDYQRALPLLISEFSNYIPDNTKYTRSIAFISQLATIENSQDIEALLQAYALPIGSSSIKRHSKSNLSLNGYVGLTGGREVAFLPDAKQNAFNIGLTAPIGVSYTHSLSRKSPKSFTFFVSLIDIGSLVNQRLGNDSVVYNNLKLETFFSPGAGLYWNFPKMPVTIGIQFSYIPNLRNITYENNNAVITTSKYTNISRFNFSTLVDIPFFTLYNRAKKD